MKSWETWKKACKLMYAYSQSDPIVVTFVGEALWFRGFIGMSIYNMGYVDHAVGRRYYLSSRLSDIENIPNIHIVLKNYELIDKYYIHIDEVDTIEYDDFTEPLTFYYNWKDYYSSLYIAYRTGIQIYDIPD